MIAKIAIMAITNMGERSVMTEAREAAEAWITAHAPGIARVMTADRDNIANVAREEGSMPLHLSYGFRMISEMPLCRAAVRICEKFPPPAGLFPVNGRLIALDDRWTAHARPGQSEEHMFITNDDGLVVDFTSAQFVKVPHSAIAGERIRELAGLAPDLVRTYPNGGLTALIGEMRKIEEILGIRYVAESGQPYD